MPPLLRHTTTTLGHRYHQIRTFINARIKWVRDPYLDAAVEREKNLKPLLSLSSLILSHPNQSLSLSFISSFKPLPFPAQKFFRKYPQFFKIFLPPHKKPPLPLPHVKLTKKALALHKEEMLILNLSSYRRDLALRLTRVLMLARAKRLPFYLIDMFKSDLGLPHDYFVSFLHEYPEYFQVCDMGFHDQAGNVVLGLELVCWRKDLAVSEMEERARNKGQNSKRVKFPMSLPKGFDLEKRVVEWVEYWQDLPYISPYENAFHLAPNSDHAEKWAVSVIHELLSLLISKKTEGENLVCFGEFVGFGRVMIKRVLRRFVGIFYVSNKIRTQTVVLREGYRKKFLVERHPLMDMRYKYVGLMNMVLRRGKPIRNFRGRKRVVKGRKRKVDESRFSRADIGDDDFD